MKKTMCVSDVVAIIENISSADLSSEKTVDKAYCAYCSLDKEKRGEVTVSRSGGVSSLMYFCAGSRYNWQYDAGFITIDFCTNTKELVNNLDFFKGGVFEVFYIMENRGVEMQRVKFSLTVK